MPKHLQRFLGVLILVFSNVAASAAGCSSTNNFSLGDHLPRPTLGIRIFDMKVSQDSPLRKMERIRTDFAETLRARLIKSGYFGDVIILAEDSDQATDFTMIGVFTQATIGSNGFNLYNILTQEAYDTASTVRIAGGILRGKDPEPVTTFQCAIECCQPFIGSPFPKEPATGMQKMKHSVDDIAEFFERTYAHMDNLKIRKGRQ